MKLDRALRFATILAVLVSALSLMIYLGMYFNAHFAFGDSVAKAKLDGTATIFIGMPCVLWISVIILKTLNTPPDFDKGSDWASESGPSKTKVIRKKRR